MNNVIVITGPTASGKTALSVELAKKLNGEIISADSMQIYKYMDIGTAKPNELEMQGIKHHMLDIILPNESYNVSRYKKEAEECIKKVVDDGKVPIITGGTGLYINSLVYNINFSETTQNNEIREDMQRTAEIMGNEYVYNILKDMDPEAAARVHANNLKRVIRSIEIYKTTGRSIIEHEAESRIIPSNYNFKVFCLNVQREFLYKRIDARVDLMMDQGLVDEVIMLENMGYATGETAMQAIGYKEILAYLKGYLTIKEAVETIQQGSRRYAKRQITWMKKIKNVTMIDYDPTQGNNVLDTITTSIDL